MSRRNKKPSPAANIEGMYPQVKMTPKEFELQVKCWIDAAGKQLEDYKSVHREKLFDLRVIPSKEFALAIPALTGWARAALPRAVQRSRDPGPIPGRGGRSPAMRSRRRTTWCAILPGPMPTAGSRIASASMPSPGC
jgi:hypothetical protein